MTEHRIGTQEEWQAERDALLKEEKELTRRNDQLARKRRELPWVPVEKQYSFETADGTKSLAELFDGRSQLLIYHFMFGPSYEAGCTVCSSIADTLDPQVVHLKARDVTLICSSRAPLERLLAYRDRMGWSFNWVSTAGSDFHRDLGFAPRRSSSRSWRVRSPPPSTRTTPPVLPTLDHVDSERLSTTLTGLWPVDRPLLAGLNRAAQSLAERRDTQAGPIRRGAYSPRPARCAHRAAISAPGCRPRSRAAPDRGVRRPEPRYGRVGGGGGSLDLPHLRHR